MPIETICQGCARKLRVDDQYAGRKARCPQCGMIYIVPGELESDAPAEPSEMGGPGAPYDGSRDPYSASWEQSAPNDVQWYVRTSDGRVYGPVARSELDEWFAEGRIPPSASVRRGTESWRPSGQLSGASNHPARSRESSSLYVDGRSGDPFGARQRGHRRPGGRVDPHRGGMILAFGILGWLFCPMFGPFAWGMGSSDLRAMRAGRMDQHGMTLTQIGMILGIIQTILLLLGAVAMCLGIVASS